MCFVFAFNHEDLVTLNAKSPADVILSLVNVNEGGIGEMHACAFKEVEGRPIVFDPTVPIGCPYPPGWAGFRVARAGEKGEKFDTVEPPKFRISAESLERVLRINQFFLEGQKQLLVRLDSEVMGGMLKTFFRLTAYSASGNVPLGEERTHPL